MVPFFVNRQGHKYFHYTTDVFPEPKRYGKKRHEIDVVILTKLRRKKILPGL